MSSTPTPSDIKLRKQSRVLELHYEDGTHFSVPWEFLRVYSPSAEVRGHHPSQAQLQWGKRNIGVRELKPAGHYALQIVFDDGHDTGLYTWDYLFKLGRDHEALWNEYLDELHAAGKSRDPDTQVLTFEP